MTLATIGRLALARSEEERRALVHRIVRVLGFALLLFSLVDDHLHVVVRSRDPSRLASNLGQSLRQARPDLALASAHQTPVEDRRHLRRLVGYVLGQPEHHELAGPSALWSGSCFLDLVGARCLPGFAASALSEELPRLKGRELHAAVGLPQVPLEPADDEALLALGPDWLVSCCASALAVGPELRGRRPLVVAAKAAAVRLSAGLGTTTRQLASVLGLTPRAVRHLGTLPLDPPLERAIRVRVTLERRLKAVG